MTRSEIIRMLHEEYARTREANRQEHDRRVEQACKQDPRLGEIVELNRALFMQQARNLLRSPDSAERMAAETKRKAASLRSEQEKRLVALGLPADYFDPVYTCRSCRDTGYVGDGVKQMCACMEKKLTNRLYDGARERGTADQRFDTFREELLPDDAAVDGVHTQREIGVGARNFCREYADSYPKTQRQGLLLTGKTGLGKTFLLHCIENRLLERGFSPVVITAYRLFETMRGCHFADEEKRREYDQLIGCDILMIDDLGTEPIMQNITREYLFTLLNERLIQRRHTVVATNLGVTELLNTYGERVFSRLFDTMNVSVCQLMGQDLRMIFRKGGK